MLHCSRQYQHAVKCGDLEPSAFHVQQRGCVPLCAVFTEQWQRHAGSEQAAAKHPASRYRVGRLDGVPSPTAAGGTPPSPPPASRGAARTAPPPAAAARPRPPACWPRPAKPDHGSVLAPRQCICQHNTAEAGRAVERLSTIRQAFAGTKCRWQRRDGLSMNTS